MGTKKYSYEGGTYTLTQLETMSDGIPKQVISERLRDGWDVETALHTPFEPPKPALDPKWRGKTLEVMFLEPIPSVIASMQPQLNTKYIAEPPAKRYTYEKTRPHYVIRLESGKPLIVYPEEFQVLAEATVSA